MRQAYTATTIAPAHVAAGTVVAAALLLANAWTGTPTWLAVVNAALVIAATAHLATVRLSISAGHVVLAQGPWPGRGRVIDTSSITTARVIELSWAQTFGASAPRRGRITRMTPRPGPALSLTLLSGEIVVISARHPHSALPLLPPTTERP